MACFAAFLFVGQFAPGMGPTWVDVTNQLTQEEADAFAAAFDFANAPVDWSDAFGRDAQMEAHMANVMGVTGTVRPDQIVEYLRTGGYENLALRMENIMLRGEVDEGTFQSFGLHLLLLVYFIPLWWLTHRFLKVPHRTARETIYVYLYTFGVFMVLLGIPVLFVEEEASGVLALYVIAALVYFFVKMLRVFRYTHDVGFWQLTKAGFKVNLVVFGAIAALALIAAALGGLDPGAAG